MGSIVNVIVVQSLSRDFGVWFFGILPVPPCFPKFAQVDVH